MSRLKYFSHNFSSGISAVSNSAISPKNVFMVVPVYLNQVILLFYGRLLAVLLCCSGLQLRFGLFFCDLFFLQIN
jgi:hypothetical protein